MSFISSFTAVGMKNRRKTQTEGEEVEIRKKWNVSVWIESKDVKRKRNPAQTRLGCFRTLFSCVWDVDVKGSRSFKKKTRRPLNNLWRQISLWLKGFFCFNPLQKFLKFPQKLLRSSSPVISSSKCNSCSYPATLSLRHWLVVCVNVLQSPGLAVNCQFRNSLGSTLKGSWISIWNQLK